MPGARCSLGRKKGRCPLHQLLSAVQFTQSLPPSLVASYADRVTFSPSGITFSTVTREDTGTYTCMVSEDNGNNYGEVQVQLTVLGMQHITYLPCGPGAGHFPKA